MNEKTENSATLTERYVDNLDKSDSKKPEDKQIFFRIIAEKLVDDEQMLYVIGVGSQNDLNDYNPVVRSARYTTEESFLFLNRERAEKYLKKFIRKEGKDLDFPASDLHVAIYRPLKDIVKIIPINTPYGRAYIGEQKSK